MVLNKVSARSWLFNARKAYEHPSTEQHGTVVMVAASSIEKSNTESVSQASPVSIRQKSISVLKLAVLSRARGEAVDA